MLYGPKNAVEICGVSMVSKFNWNETATGSIQIPDARTMGMVSLSLLSD